MKLYWLILVLKVVRIPIVLEGLSNVAQSGVITTIKHSDRITQEPHQVAADRGEQAITRSSCFDLILTIYSI